MTDEDHDPSQTADSLGYAAGDMNKLRRNQRLRRIEQKLDRLIELLEDD